MSLLAIIITTTTSIPIPLSLSLSLSGSKNTFKDRVGVGLEYGLAPRSRWFGLSAWVFDDIMLRHHE